VRAQEGTESQESEQVIVVGEGEEVRMVKRRISVLFALSILVLVALWTPGSALAVGPQWTVSAMSQPTNFAPIPGSTGTYVLLVQNTGGAPSDGSTITVTDSLPAGLKVIENASGADWVSGTPVSCTGAVCTYSGSVAVDDFLEVKVPVEVQAGAPASVTNVVSVSGGGASEATREAPTAITSAPAPFGIAPGSASTVLSDSQAGAHPDLTTSLYFTTAGANNLLAGDAKDTTADLPPGFVGDVADMPRCPISTFTEQTQVTTSPCPASTQVGTTTVDVNLGIGGGEWRFTEPLFNLSTNPGEITRFGFHPSLFGIQGTVTLRPGDYGVRTTFHNIPNSLPEFVGISLTVWGVPSDKSHDAMRGTECLINRYAEYCRGGPQTVTSAPIPFLTSPTQCTTGPLGATLSADSWQEPGVFVSEPTSIGPLTECNLLEFPPEIRAAPDTTRADTPAGFTFGVKVPQEGLVKDGGLSSADIENTRVALPAGVVVNPGQANGLGACQTSQAALESEGPPSCPSNSKVGHVEVETPLLKRKLEGEVYLLASNPPDLKLLVAPADPVDGIYVKFVGNVHLDETTGQLVTTFEKTPELPFSDLRLSFSGGAQAALATPTGCGVYTTNADFSPWSGEPDALLSSGFAIDSGTGGAPCPSSPLPFSPSMDAGSTTDQAGGFTGFSLLLQRADDQQRISTLQFKTPEGLLGMIAKIPLCEEPQASQGTCSGASQIGHTVVEAGPGPYPLVVPQPGSPPAPIYLTGPYKGAPFGLSIVVPVVVGPFDLGTIVVRSKIDVDPNTSRLTVTTDPLPSIIKGVPSDLRTIVAQIDRPGFMFNPTNCEPMSFSGTATSLEGATAGLATHFQMGSCRALAFKPDFKVSTSGKTSRANGASLDAKIVYPTGPLGSNQASSQSNIRYVKVDLPRQLPSRLETLKRACVDTVFEQNPAACPQASKVGQATAVTPVLPVSLTGPAYFVSHGGQRFPELVIVLQGYGVSIYLHGETFISKAGVTSSTFRQVPDVPIYSFELKLPQGPDSALAANGNLCASTLRMPTMFTAQDGMEIHQSTPINVTGCTRHKTHHKHRKHKKRKHKKK
jgi:uncharacterized repeat protein (TIGR01451 family)